jgi:hypothetical protein
VTVAIFVTYAYYSLTELAHLYLAEQLTNHTIADKLKVNPRNIHDAMIRWRIPRRPHSAQPNRPAPASPFDEATLRYHYHDAGQTIRQIAEHFDVSTSVVFPAMKYWAISHRRCGPRPVRSGNEQS